MKIQRKGREGLQYLLDDMFNNELLFIAMHHRAPVGALITGI